jgi:DNA-binding NarL/FixJ family response regulator
VTLRLVLIEDDSAYRSALALWLEPLTDIEVVAECRLSEAIACLHEHLPNSLNRKNGDRFLTILGLSSITPKSEATSEWQICGRVRSQFPQLPILIVGVSAEPILVAAAQRAGANGFWLRNSHPDALVATIRRVANGQNVWIGRTAPIAAAGGRSGAFGEIRRNLRITGVRRMEGAIADLSQQLRDGRLTQLERLILEGRRREVRAARWLVQQLLATPALSDWERDASATQQIPDASANVSAGEEREGQARSQAITPTPSSTNNASELEPVPAIAPLKTHISILSLQAILVDAVLSNIQSSVANLTGAPLETDILQSARKQELFGLILRKLENLLEDLRQSQIAAEQLDGMQSQLLLDLWETVTEDFFGRYSTLIIQETEVPLVDRLLSDAPLVDATLLRSIPYFETLLSHLLFQTPLMINGNAYPAGNPESLLRAEFLLGHSVVQLANAVVQPLLNQFADVEAIKQNFYDRRLMSTREVERFRNDLSWHYRMRRYFGTPRDIFESRHQLLTFQPRGIQARSVYAPRRDELEDLTGIPYAVTLVLETRDAIAPRLRASFSVVGSALVYVLTEVLGRSIGLVGRGIIKGVGNVWQETRYSRDSEPRQ